MIPTFRKLTFWLNLNKQWSLGREMEEQREFGREVMKKNRRGGFMQLNSRKKSKFSIYIDIYAYYCSL